MQMLRATKNGNFFMLQEAGTHAAKKRLNTYLPYLFSAVQYLLYRLVYSKVACLPKVSQMFSSLCSVRERFVSLASSAEGSAARFSAAAAAGVLTRTDQPFASFTQVAGGLAGDPGAGDKVFYNYFCTLCHI